MVWPFGGSQRSEESTPVSTTAPEPIQSSSEPQSSSNNSSNELPSFLSGPLDGSKLHPLAGLGSSLEILDLEDDQISELPGSRGILPSRGWSDDLCYGSGSMYMGGLAVGGFYGFAEGLRASPTNAPFKIKLNSILNAVTRRGPFLGNSAGVLAISYNIFNGLFSYFRDYHDIYNSVAAGTITGLLFRSTRGLKPMALSGALMGTAAGAWNVLSNSV
ncbi:Tim17/Tim22/Tim23/Pmp24 family-domain-containing protein [Dipodascopsis uninucleata]